MKRLLLLLGTLILSSLPAFATGECAALNASYIPWLYGEVRDSSGVVHESLCVNLSGQIVPTTFFIAGTGLQGSGSINTLPKFVTNTTTLGNSNFTDVAGAGTYAGASGFTSASLAATAGITAGTTIVANGNITSTAGDVTAQNIIAAQPADSLNLFGDPVCGWENNWTAGTVVGMLCYNVATGALTWNASDSGQLDVKVGSHNCPGHTWFGNNTGNSGPDQDCSSLGIQDLVFGVNIGGSANTYTVCPSPAVTSLVNGLWLVILNGSTSLSNSGASTLNVCGLGAKSIVKNTTGGALAALASGDLKWNAVCPCASFALFYDASDSEWVLTNPLSFIPNNTTPTTTWLSIYAGAPMTTANTFTANQHNLSCFQVPVQITTSAVVYNVTTADNTANLYDIGIADVNGNIIAHTGATAGTSFAPGTGKQTLNWLSSVTLNANTNYWLDVTCATCTAKLGGTVTGACFNANTGTTSGGALTNFTPPGTYQTGWNVVNAVPNVLLH